MDEMFGATDRLVAAIERGDELPGADWLRVLLMTEIVFASNAIGSGLDWSITSGLTDEESLVALRSVQRKLGGIGNLLALAFGTRPPGD